jgi:hypothetical protein
VTPRARRALAAFPLLAILGAAVLACASGGAAPSMAEAHEKAGLAAARSAAGPDESRAAIDELIEAIRLRPVSPYAWAALAEARYRAGDSGEGFQLALVRAAELGPHEPDVQDAVAFFGLAVWDELGPQARAAIDRMIADGARRDAEAMLRIAERRGRLAVVCRHVPPTSRIPEKWTRLCKSAEAR